jgi:hypothetical protein
MTATHPYAQMLGDRDPFEVLTETQKSIPAIAQALGREGLKGCGKTLQCCHPEPVRCHSERSEESRSAAQGKLREGSRSEHFQGNARFFLRKAQDRRCSSAETRRVSPWNSAGVARTCFLGPRHVPDGQGKAADLKNRSALPFLGPSFCLSWAAKRLSMLRMTALSSFSAACKAPPFQNRGVSHRKFASGR